MRILALMKYGPGAAGTRQRMVLYEPYLAAHGIEVERRTLLDDDYIAGLQSGRRPDIGAIAASYARRFCDLLRARDYDLIWVYYEGFPWLPSFVETLPGRLGKPLVFDFDDAVFHRYDAHRSGAVRALLGRKFEPLLSRVDACSCGNAYLRDYARHFCANAVIIPTVVDTDRYRPRSQPRGDSEPLVVGWIGSPSNWPHVEALLPVISPTLARHGARLRIVGAGREARGVAGIDWVEWTETGEIAEVQAMDIGIMPTPDEPFARGKCGFKLVQYMACGLPVVASPVGVNTEIVASDVNGFLADGPDQWVAHLDRLLGDAALRRRLGAAGRERVVERYSLAAQAPRVLALIRAAVEAHAARQVAPFAGSRMASAS
jgi:glycosyltransferase involved in cell wall biosynthesis